MKIIDADPTRMIDLPGVGPCPRPVDIDQRITGFETLKSLRIYLFQPRVTIEGESEVDEVYVVPLDGEVRMEISGPYPLTATLDPDKNRALYMTPHHAYRLTPSEATHVAYARAQAVGKVPTHAETRDFGDRAEQLWIVMTNLSDDEALDMPTDKERLIHVAAGNMKVGGTTITAQQTIALAAGEDADLRADGAAFVLMISA